jgi:transposase
VAAVIRIDAVWLAVQPIDMRAGAEGLLARVVQVFGAAKSHHGYLFANARGTRIKLLVHDGFGVWCAARRLNQGRFLWPRDGSAAGITDPGAVRCAGARAAVAAARADGRHHAHVSEDRPGNRQMHR